MNTGIIGDKSFSDTACLYTSSKTRLSTGFMTMRNYAVLYTIEWARLKSDNEACLPPLYTHVR